ncbi:MAG: sigma-E processing peptidase SpoIIGA [Clostridia bacterium]|nr:sigma-E processing peptidase SpoIIGA [Clostridia bacterium]
MEQIIYADILFIVNFSMDFLALYIASKLLHNNCHFASLIMSAGIGAVYGVASLFLSGSGMLNALINTAVALLMCYIVFGSASILYLIRNTLCFYGISFLMGGVMTGVYNLANKGITGRGIVINGDSASLVSEIPPLTLIIIAVASVVFSYVCSAVTTRLRAKKKASVYIRIGNKDVNMTGLCDSGNLLLEPAGSLPCLICNLKSIEKLLPVGVIPLFRDMKLGLLEYTDPALAKKIRLVPMRSVGGSGIRPGIIPDEIRINGEPKRLCIVCDSENDSYGGTEAIIPTSVL